MCYTPLMLQISECIDISLMKVSIIYSNIKILCSLNLQQVVHKTLLHQSLEYFHG